MHFTCKTGNDQYFRVSFHLHRNPLDEQCSILVNAVFAFRARRFHSDKGFQRKNICFQKMPFGGFAGWSEEKPRKWPQVWASDFCYKRFFRWNFAISDCSWCKPHARCISNAKYQASEMWDKTFFFCPVNFAKSLFSPSAIHTQIPLAIEIIAWRIHQPQYGKNIRMSFSHTSLSFLV